MPSIEELRSLLDGTGLLPAGVFSIPAGEHYYWSTPAEIATNFNALAIRFDVVANNSIAQKDQFSIWHAWCVRGGAGLEGQRTA